MTKKQRKELRRRPATREYRRVCWISAEGKTERDYFSMEAFRRSPYAIRFPKDIHPNRRNPAAVLKRFQKTLREEDFRKDDAAWLVVDVDSYDA
ncbi:RloB domain-containing protein [Paratractidigestivibacter sp.]|uniref:RloB domain-containing protein n=1 Tax=Paratractidigestivibacter sp. TaxID=2847316 RepID=UPI002AC92630|nr:RloB domain-containing protein [Paratractidigestivibacter sp.]